MNKRILCIAFLTLALALPALAFAGQKDEASNGPWIHIEVREHDGDGASVNVNLPISLADVALKMAQEKSGTAARTSASRTRTSPSRTCARCGPKFAARATPSS